MESKVIIAPSLLSADFSCLKKQLEAIEGLVDAWHIDVMDGHFVPNITLGPFIVQHISSIVTKPLDVHLMITDPLKYSEAFLSAGAEILTAHIEALESDEEVKEFIDKVKDHGRKVGLSLKPATHPQVLLPYLDDLDMILIMTVEPGFGGQTFMDSNVYKIGWLKEKGFGGYIAVDGGINHYTAKIVKDAGANFIIAGSFVFSSDPVEAIKQLKEQ